MAKAAKARRAQGSVKDPWAGRVVEVPHKFDGKTDLEKVFGPPWVVIAKHGEAELHDLKEHYSHLLDKSRAERVMAYEEFYEFKGGILGHITKKHGEPWMLGVTVSTLGQFPNDAPEEFLTWEAAWAYVVEHL